MAIFWASIPIGFALVAASVGIPFLLTHRGMHPGNPAKAHAYLEARADMAQTEDPGERRQAYLAAMARRSDSALRLSRQFQEPGSWEETSWQGYRPR